jgi:2-methylisocitrate lyase-like PEP mutase family enzyme
VYDRDTTVEQEYRPNGDIPPYLQGRQRPALGLRELLGRPGSLLVPGVTDVLTARLAEQAGFDAVLLSGAGLANALFGVADVGLTGLRDITDATTRIARGVRIPLIADADTGYGNAISVMHTVSALEAAGAAAVHIEDQVFPKRCGHFDRKAVIDADEMVQKIRAAQRARSSLDLLLVARTDARAPLGFDEALDRAKRYADAGADVVFLEAPQNDEELERVPRELAGVPLMANMVEGGKTPLHTRRELETMGYKVIVYANLALRAATWAVRNAFDRLRADGDSRALLNSMITWQERQDLVFLSQVEALEDEFAISGDARRKAALDGGESPKAGHEATT